MIEKLHYLICTKMTSISFVYYMDHFLWGLLTIIFLEMKNVIVLYYNDQKHELKLVINPVRMFTISLAPLMTRNDQAIFFINRWAETLLSTYNFLS